MTTRTVVLGPKDSRAFAEALMSSDHPNEILVQQASERRRRASDRAPFMPALDDAVYVRSKFSGNEGLAYIHDPHIWVEGPGIAGWYRLSSLERDFIRESDQ